MSRYYPIYLNLKGKKCVVVGGGEVAERKALLLEDCQAKVTLISSSLTSCLKSMVDEGRISHLERPFKQGDLQGAFLVIGATSDRDVNREIFEEATEKGILVNIVDDPDLCNFIVPSLVRRGDLLLSISTGGIAPGLSRKIRQDLEKEFGEEYEEYLKLLADFRHKVKAKYPDKQDRYQAWQRILSSDLLERIRKGETVDLEEFL